MLNYLVMFACGAVSGAGILLLVSYNLAKKEQKRQEEENLKLQQQQDEQAKRIYETVKQARADLARAKNALATAATTSQAAQPDTVQTRLRKAIDITLKQVHIDTRASHDNKLEYNNLELEKLAILKTILADGFDPPITIRFDSGDREMLLSNYVASLQKSLN